MLFMFLVSYLHCIVIGLAVINIGKSSHLTAFFARYSKENTSCGIV